jgi:hypothetical protein
MGEKSWFEILGGILIVLSSVVGEHMPRRLKWAVYLFFALLAVVYSIVGIRIDQAANRRTTEAEAEAKQSRLDLVNTGKMLIDAQNQVIAKTEENARLSQELYESVTGGNEFAYLKPLLAEDQQQHRLFLIISHDGKVPIYDVGFRVLDFRKSGIEPIAAGMLTNDFNIGNLAAKQLRFVAYWPLVPGKTHYGFNFFFTARNAAGFVVQQLRYVKINEKWLSATEVRPLNSTRSCIDRLTQDFQGMPKGKLIGMTMRTKTDRGDVLISSEP